MNKKPIYLKYLLSISTLLLLVNMLIIYIVRDKQSPIALPVWNLVVSGILWVVAFAMIITYWWIKFNEMKKNDFEFTKKDYKFALMSMTTYLIEVFVGLIFIIAGNFMLSITAIFWCFLVLIIILSMAGSVLEMFSRITYQIFLNQKAYMEYEASHDSNIQNNSVDHQEAEIISSNVKRSKEAEEILNKDAINKKNPFEED